MARGSESKENITKKLLETFCGSFVNGKEIRVPMVENGEVIEIKITLTAAKDVVGGETVKESSTSVAETAADTPWEEPSPPSADEIAIVKTMLDNIS
jgi:hypothetical protein